MQLRSARGGLMAAFRPHVPTTECRKVAIRDRRSDGCGGHTHALYANPRSLPDDHPAGSRYAR